MKNYDENTGIHNAGCFNSGDYNAGNSNVGNFNEGDYNTGDKNVGSCNTGNYNIGDCNAGSLNIGDWNMGNYNVGDWNTGDYNACCGSSGCFNTQDVKITMFNKPSDWTLNDWLYSKARMILGWIPKKPVRWIDKEDMTAFEKEEHPGYKTTGGCLERICITGAQAWWDALKEEHKKEILSLPNFNADIFEARTGIRV